MIRSLSVQLTLRFLVLFTFLFLSAFTFVYWHLKSTLHDKIDETLTKNAFEIAKTLRTEGLKEAIKEVHLEAEAEGVGRVFIRFFTPEQELITTSDLTAWSELNVKPRKPASETGQVLDTITLPGRHHQVRLLHQGLDGGYLLQMGFLLKEDDRLLEDFRSIFAIAFAIMILGGALSGYLISRRAMKGVERIRQTADRIGQGDFSHRVELEKDGEEIENLGRAFNQMQDRIQVLIGELKDVTNNIAHDLRSPLTRIRGLAETTLTGKQELAEYRNMAGTIIEESDRMVGMVNTMLEIAETDAGIREIPKISVNLGDIVIDVGELFSTVAEDKGVELQVLVASAPLCVQGDRPRLQRAVANLLDNAIKYTPAGGRVTIQAEAEGAQTLISIADTGIGIPAQEQKSIFNRFYRLDQSRSTPGAGLGLSLVQAVVRAHGGMVQVESEVGRGSVFTIRLPRKPI
ncbi:MAG: HAMP domain-containing sensor histidine kinase [Desulfuromonadales bacterium]|nr:HAMP domain-containing sensor histidine kinase [Desulfuromonadales bacterium]